MKGIWLALAVVACGGSQGTNVALPTASAEPLPASPTASTHASTGSFDGRYVLDKLETKKAMEAAAVTDEQRSMAHIAATMFDSFDVEVELTSGGAATMRFTMHEKGPNDTNVQHGSWSRESDDMIVLASGDGKDLHCKKRDAQLSCVGPPDKEADKTLVLVFTRR